VAGVESPEARALLDSARAKLFAVRERRVRPGRDEKVLVSWNALVILGMARAGRALNRPEWVDSARRALGHIRLRMWRDGRLLATTRTAGAHLSAYLDDYAFLVAALLELLQCEYVQADLDFARDLAGALLERFEDPESRRLLFHFERARSAAVPPQAEQRQLASLGQRVAALALGRLAALTGEDRPAARRAAHRRVVFALLRSQPAGCADAAQALDEILTPPSVLVLRAPDALAEWTRSLAAEFLPETLVLAIPEGTPGLPPALDKPQHSGPVTGGVPRTACLAPATIWMRSKRHASRGFGMIQHPFPARSPGTQSWRKHGTREVALTLIAAAVAAGVAGCSEKKQESRKRLSSPRATAPSRPPPSLEVKIGHVGPAYRQHCASSARTTRNGARLAVERANAAKIKIDWQGRRSSRSSPRRSGRSEGRHDGRAKARRREGQRHRRPPQLGHVDSGFADLQPGRHPGDLGSATNPKLTEQGFKTQFRVVGRDDQQGPAIASYLAENKKAEARGGDRRRNRVRQGHRR
jgi:hypothetical protein